jgi:hypothetical protein
LQDPVDAWELQRNNRIEQEQGNRNPYIDYPEIACKAWGLECIEGIEDSDNNVMIFPTFFSEQIQIVSRHYLTEISIYDITGKTILNQKFNNNEIILNLQYLKTGFYIIEIRDNYDKIIIEKLIKE